MAIYKQLLYESSGTSWHLTGVSDRQFYPSLFLLAISFAGRGRAKKRTSVATILQEAADLLIHFDQRPNATLAWNGRYERAPSHHKRGLTELMALGITAHCATLYGWDPRRHHMFGFDDLQLVDDQWTERVRAWVAPGVRPDILFETPAGLRAMESRGRTVQRQARSKPTSQQEKRLSELEGWASSVGVQIAADPAWGMCWASFSRTSTLVDLFDPGEPVSLDRRLRVGLDNLRMRLRPAAQYARTEEDAKVLDVRDQTGRVYRSFVLALSDAQSAIRYIAICVPEAKSSASVRVDVGAFQGPEILVSERGRTEWLQRDGWLFVVSTRADLDIDGIGADLAWVVRSEVRRSGLAVP